MTKYYFIIDRSRTYTNPYQKETYTWRYVAEKRILNPNSTSNYLQIPIEVSDNQNNSFHTWGFKVEKLIKIKTYFNGSKVVDHDYYYELPYGLHPDALVTNDYILTHIHNNNSNNDMMVFIPSRALKVYTNTYNIKILAST